MNSQNVEQWPVGPAEKVTTMNGSDLVNAEEPLAAARRRTSQK